MAKYNIYKIEKSKEKELIEKIESVGLTRVGTKGVGEFELVFYFSKKPDDIEIWWIGLYEGFLENEENQLKNRVYYGVIIVRNENVCYAISMGKSHFYLKDYCDSDFGIHMAERIVDKENLKTKSSKLFGGRKSKMILTYQENSEIEYDSGESVQYLKAKTVNEEKWGKTASFGNSLQLKIKRPLTDVPGLILQIEEELKKAPNLKLPRAVAVSDKKEKARLDKKLVKAIYVNKDSHLHSVETTISGVEFIFIDKSNYSFFVDHRTYPIEGELDIKVLKEFVEENNIDLYERLDEIKIQLEDEHSRPFKKPLRYFLEYVDEENFFLQDGKWHSFNQNYLEFLKEQIDSIGFEEDSNGFSEKDYEEWKKTLSGKEKDSPTYPEYYFNKVQKENGYILLDRDLERIEGRFSLERADLYKDKVLYFVKIGEPRDFSYVVTQSLTTLKVLQNKALEKKSKGIAENPDSLCLWLLADKKKKIKSIADFNSIIFLIKLAEWKRQCINAEYKPLIKLGYVV